MNEQERIQPRPTDVAALARREILKFGMSGLASAPLLWSDWLHAAAADKAPSVRRAKSVILLFNAGAPSHLDLWDMKPKEPDSVRGPYRPIATKAPGTSVSELTPNVARHTDKMAIVRTLHHTHTQHNAGMHWSIVGRPYRIDNTLVNPSRTDFPSVGTLVGWLARRDGYAGPLPPYVITPFPHCDSLKYLTPGQFGGCLGPKFDPFVVNSDPNAANFQVPDMGLVQGVNTDRLALRRVLLDRLGDHVRLPSAESAREYEVNQQKALTLMTSSTAGRAFDLTLEPAKVRERYGRHSWGQSHLLARRLIEAGAHFVTTVNGPSITWDTHKDNFNQLKNRLVPPMERAYAALLDDLEERGLLDTTLVVWMGDFGRTPNINGNAGRDHWPQCYSMVLAGGGIRGGQVIGESDRIGAVPRLRPVTPADIHATIFQALG